MRSNKSKLKKIFSTSIVKKEEFRLEFNSCIESFAKGIHLKTGKKVVLSESGFGNIQRYYLLFKDSEWNGKGNKEGLSKLLNICDELYDFCKINFDIEVYCQFVSPAKFNKIYRECKLREIPHQMFVSIVKMALKGL